MPGRRWRVSSRVPTCVESARQTRSSEQGAGAEARSWAAAPARLLLGAGDSEGGGGAVGTANGRRRGPSLPGNSRPPLRPGGGEGA